MVDMFWGGIVGLGWFWMGCGRSSGIARSLWLSAFLLMF